MKVLDIGIVVAGKLVLTKKGDFDVIHLLMWFET